MPTFPFSGIPFAQFLNTTSSSHLNEVTFCNILHVFNFRNKFKDKKKTNKNYLIQGQDDRY